MIDVTKLKEMIEGVEGARNSSKYIFYYDETNNYQRVRISENGLTNNDAFTKNYILGGFCCLKDNKEMIDISINELFNKKLIKYLRGEIKGYNLFKDCKSFIECLNKMQVTEILNWVYNNGFIHYTTMNCFYYSITDIVDSFFTEEPEILIPKVYIDIIKSQLYHLINGFFKEEFIELANQINYPNVEEKNIKILCDWLISIIDRVNGRENFEFELFRQIIKSKRNSEELIFLKNNNDKIIFENFYSLRQQKCIIFDDSYHIFDKELRDEKFMSLNPMTKDGKTIFVNYTFEDSKKYRLIQISDVVVSLIGKFFDYIDNNSIEVIKKEIKTINKTQKYNLKQLINLINKSYNEEKFLIEALNSMDYNMSRNNIMKYIERALIEDSGE